MKNKQYLKKIQFIIFLTNIPMILTLPMFFKHSLGWILGSLAATINFRWMAYNIENNFDTNSSKLKLKIVKNFYFRFLFLIVYSVLVVKFIKPDIIIFGLGLLSAQIAIYINAIYERVKRNKYFRGENGSKKEK